MTMAMVTSGHVAHARAMINETFYLAWGDLGVGYPDPWGLDQVPPVSTSLLHTQTLTKGAANTAQALAKPGVIKIVSVRDANNVLYTQGVDYYLDANTVNWSLGGIEPAVGVNYTVVYRYFTEDITTLINEVGRRKVSEKAYVVEDNVNGDIVANDKRWRRVNYPTENLYLNFRFEATEAVNTSIYQVALYVDTEVDPALPPGQMYFLPAQIVDPGSAYMIENLEPFPRNAGKREIFEYVITY